MEESEVRLRAVDMRVSRMSGLFDKDILLGKNNRAVVSRGSKYYQVSTSSIGVAHGATAVRKAALYSVRGYGLVDNFVWTNVLGRDNGLAVAARS